MYILFSLWCSVVWLAPTLGFYIDTCIIYDTCSPTGETKQRMDSIRRRAGFLLALSEQVMRVVAVAVALAERHI